MSKLSQAAQQLAAMVKPAALNQSDVAKRLNVSRAAVAAWVAGDALPSYASRMALRDEYEIDPDAWDKPAKKAS